MPQRPRRDPPLADVTPVQNATLEAALLDRVRAGDEAAFEELFKEYYRGLCDFVRGYVRSRDTAEELVQTVFLRIWEKRETWRPAAAARACVFAACRNSSLDHLRHERVVERSVTAACAGEPEAGGGTPSTGPTK